jgi:glycosyltransferase involved in cell wall biosynthesis
MKFDVSVVIPSYNYVAFVGVAVESALGQTLAPLEIIVVDDGSKDDSIQSLARFGDRIRVIQQENRGVAAARNTGVAASRGSFVAFLDADDIWLPGKLEKQAARFAREPDIGMVHCGMAEVDREGHVLRTQTDGLEGDVAASILLNERRGVVAAGSTAMIPRRVFDEVGGYNSRCPPSEDWDLSFRVARRYRIGFVPEVLMHYRQHGAGGHLNLRRWERGAFAALESAFAVHDPRISPLRRRAYGNVHRLLAGSYFRAGQYRDFARHAARSIILTPENAKHFVAFPVRWVRRALGAAKI